HHRTLELGVVAPHRRAGLCDEDVAGLELDVVRDRVRPRAPKADLAPVPRLDAVRGALLPGVAERLEHRERRLLRGTQARLRLGDPRTRVLLEQTVPVRAPAPALPDQRDLVLALPRHHALDEIADRRDGGAGHVAQRRPAVTEDPRVAVLVRGDLLPEPEI